MIRTGNLDLYGRTLKVAVHSLSADEMSNKSNVLCVVSSFAVMLFSGSCYMCPPTIYGGVVGVVGQPITLS